jgi:hypothetical protein
MDAHSRMLTVAFHAACAQVIKEVPQPIEKVQYREVPVPVEVIVERVVEKIIIKEVPVEKV